MKLKEIAEILGGKLIGDGETEIKGLSSLKDAKEGELSFLFRKAYLPAAKKTEASAVIAGYDLDPEDLPQKNLILTHDPFASFLKLHDYFVEKSEEESFVSPLAYVSEDVKIGEGVRIYPFVYIGKRTRIGENVVIHPFVHIGKDVTIGDGSRIYPNVTIYDRVVIGKRVIIHSGSVIGSDGFGYFWDGKEHKKIPQIGTVQIEDDCEIGAGVTIDRATLGKTLIRRGTKIDNLVQIGHNVTIGEDSIVVAQVGIGGSAEIGNRVIIAGQAGIKDHVKIGDDSRIGGQAGVTKDIPKGSEVMGTPHMERKEWARIQAYIKRLPEIFAKIKCLEGKMSSGSKDG